MSWLGKAFSDNGEPSSKRLAGVIGLAIVHIAWALCVLKESELSNNTEDLGTMLAFLDAGLLGVTTIAQAFKKQPNEKD